MRYHIAMFSRTPARGMSLVDVIIGSALTLIIFVALFGLLRASFTLSSLTKSKSIATAIASSHVEYIRSLAYDDIGTIGGIPSGLIPEVATTTQNNLTFVTRTFIRYVDDPADGLDAADVTGIITDYKQVKVTVNYTLNGSERSVELISNQSPVGLETTTGGGTLLINAVSAAGVGIAGAEVHIENPSLAPAVNLTTFTNAAGLVYLPGAATSTDYRISVTKDGYSTAQTYARDATNQNPTPGYLTVVQNVTTTGTFAIDLLSDLTIRTLSPPTTVNWIDGFADATKISATTNTGVSASALTLVDPGTGYPGSGSAVSTTVTPSSLSEWTEIDATLGTTVATGATVQVVDAAGTLIPDTELPGNSTGFTTFPVSLTGVSTTTHAALALRATLTSTDPLQTPEVRDWTLTYKTAKAPLPNIAFGLQGAKTVGSTGAGAAIYKTTLADTTGTAASKTLALEWDAYTLTLAGYDIIDACNAPHYALSPGTATDSSLTLGADTTHMVLVSVKDAAGAAVPGAEVTLSRGAYTETVTASSCGAAYFGGLTTASDYTVTIHKSGYTDETFTSVTVTGSTFYVASFE